MLFEILFAIMCVVFWGYVGFIVSAFGILPSLSDSYYHLPLKSRDIIFWAVFATSGMLAAIVGQCGFMFGAGFGIALVGTAPQFKEDFVKPVHVAGALMAALFSQLFIIFITPYWWISVIFALSCLATYVVCKLTKSKDLTWWLEMCCFVSTFIALGLNTFNQYTTLFFLK